MIKIALVYTGTTPQLTELVESEIKKTIEAEIEFLNYKDPTIINEVRESGYVNSQAAARLIQLFMRSVQDGADVILNICSSVGEVADSAQNIASYLGVPIVRIDEEMCRAAVTQYDQIGVIATLETTLTPTKNTLLRVGREAKRYPRLVDGLVEGAFDLDEKEFKQAILKKVKSLKKEVKAVVFCQGSMAYCDSIIQEESGVKVFSSPKYGARALKRTLESIGKLEVNNADEH